MNKKRNAVVLILVFVLQLLVPVGMVSYSAYIEWGLENRATVYKLPLAAVEWMHSESVYLQFDFSMEGTQQGTYCSLQTGKNGFAVAEVTRKKPDGNYIRSDSGRWFYFPAKVRSYEPKLDITEDDYRWLYFVPASQKEEWGWRQTENYFEIAYAEVHVFKGHAVTKAVFIDDKTIEEHIAECIRINLRND